MGREKIGLQGGEFILVRVLGSCNEITPKCQSHMSLVSRAPSTCPCLNTSMRSVSRSIFTHVLSSARTSSEIPTLPISCLMKRTCARMYYDINSTMPLYKFMESKIIIVPHTHTHSYTYNRDILLLLTLVCMDLFTSSFLL